MSRIIYGTIRNKENGSGVGGLSVGVCDADVLRDDALGRTVTDAAGAYAIDIPERSGLFDKPDVYLMITTRDEKFLCSTRNAIVKNVVKDTKIDVDISHVDLFNAGITLEALPEWKKITDFMMANPKYRALTLESRSESDPVIREIREELSGCVSVLDLMRRYTEELHGNASNNSPVFAKMGKLFEYGLPFDEMGGHYYGIGIGLMTVPLKGKLGEYGNILNYIYSTFQGRDSAWIGKTHWEIDQAELDRITGGTVKPKGKVYRGVNHFHKLEFNANNPFFFELANFWLCCEDATPYQREKYHVDKNGAGLIAYPTTSIFNKNKKVFRLSYRWPFFKNPFPIKWIFDEMVQIAHGVYLGRLLCATRRLFEPYDPLIQPEEYGYENWGYFLLVSDDWAPEARRLFRYLDISPDASH